MPSIAYFQKKFIPLADARIGIMTHALHYGTGVFEGIRGNWNAEKKELYLFRLKEHYDRLAGGCRVLKIDLEQSVEEMCKITVEVVKRCGYKENIYVRPMAYTSSESLGVRLHDLQSDFFVFAFPWGPYLDTEKASCCVSSWRRPKEVPQAKITGLYVGSALAKTEAISNGFHEAIMLTSDGFVAEGSGENFFLIKNGKMSTPPVYNNILMGITRATVIEVAKKELGIETAERPIDRTELYTADECFMTGTAANITAVCEMDRRKIGDGEVGKITRQLQELYNEIIKANNPKYAKWCTPVYKK